MNARKLTQTFNGTVEWSIAGGYFKLLSTVNPVDVELLNSGVSVANALAVEGGFYMRIPFTTVRITTSANEAVSFLAAPDEGGSDRFTGTFSLAAGQVIDVTDRAARLLGALTAWNGKNRTGSPGFWGSSGGTPVQNMHCQLFNPGASGKTLLVDRVMFDVGANADVWWYRHNAQIGGPGTAGHNKTVGGAAAVGLTSSLDQVGPSGTQVWYTTQPAGNTRDIQFDEPITIPQGQSIILRAGVTTRLLASFEWREV